ARGVRLVEGRHQPLADVAVQMQDQIADAVARFIRPPPDLPLGQRFDAAAQARPVLIEQLGPREVEKQACRRISWHHVSPQTTYPSRSNPRNITASTSRSSVAT